MAQCAKKKPATRRQPHRRRRNQTSSDAVRQREAHRDKENPRRRAAQPAGGSAARAAAASRAKPTRGLCARCEHIGSSHLLRMEGGVRCMCVLMRRGRVRVHTRPRRPACTDSSGGDTERPLLCLQARIAADPPCLLLSSISISSRPSRSHHPRDDTLGRTGPAAGVSRGQSQPRARDPAALPSPRAHATAHRVDDRPRGWVVTRGPPQQPIQGRTTHRYR